MKRIPRSRSLTQSVDLNQPVYKQQQNFQLLLLLNQPAATSKKENNGGKKEERIGPRAPWKQMTVITETMASAGALKTDQHKGAQLHAQKEEQV
jgi:hypothetical protein